MRQRLAALILLTAGLTLGGVTLGQRTPAAGKPLAEVVNAFGPTMSDSGRAQLRTDLDAVRAGAAGLNTAALPALAQATDQTPAQLQAAIAQRYPDVATGLTELPGILDRFDGVANLLDARAADFDKVDAIPVDGVTPRTVPPALLVVSALLILLGGGLLLRPSGRALPATAAGLGAVVFVLALAVTLPAKADASARVADALDPVLQPAGVAAVQRDLATVNAMAAQLRDELIPQTAAALNTTPAALVTQLGTASPAVGTLLRELPAAQARFGALATTLQENTGTWRLATRPDLVLIVRTLLATSAAAVLAGVLALSAGGLARRRRSEVEPVATPEGRGRTIPAQPAPAETPKHVGT